MTLTTLLDDARLAVLNIADRATGLSTPTVKLGVTGLSRAGKTVFITALVHNLLHGGRLPLFDAWASGRMTGAELNPQPDDGVPRFDYEAHIARLVEERLWPDSTRRIAELRVTLAFESASLFNRALGRGRLHVDIVDYPGEWLLDLPLLGKTFGEWSAETIARARTVSLPSATAWLGALDSVGVDAPEDETKARELATLFTTYLGEARTSGSLAMLAPGRFLTPGDLDGSPALTFAPLRSDTGGLARLMTRRFEAYKSIVVRPFFRDHFARLDRQIVLVDALPALNAGAAALADLRSALSDILGVFRSGRSGWWASLLTRRINRILVAATKADHLHHDDHDRLEAILGHLLKDTIGSAELSGAMVEVVALASVRATREATMDNSGQALPAIVGTPLPGSSVNGKRFDGVAEIALFPGDLPDDPSAISDNPHLLPPASFIGFRPPPLQQNQEGFTLSLPHIRLDRALQFLIGDHLQ